VRACNAFDIEEVGVMEDKGIGMGAEPFMSGNMAMAVVTVVVKRVMKADGKLGLGWHGGFIDGVEENVIIAFIVEAFGIPFGGIGEDNMWKGIPFVICVWSNVHLGHAVTVAEWNDVSLAGDDT
jgi:hypothetical protein